jgi:hypothetical protein
MLRISLILLTCCILFSFCERTGEISGAKLIFSSDTVLFDTVFSSVGSVTRELRIRNPDKNSMIIDHIYLAGGKSSSFRLNIDGEPVNEKFNVRLNGGDSTYIFVDVFIDPRNSNSPVEVIDSIVFVLSGINQSVKLLAWGQDIHLIKSGKIINENWQQGKPYVIYDNVTVDTLGTLTINEGTKVYFHKNASMTIAGTLIVKGSTGSRVLFASDRLEKIFEDIPGHWKGILILNSSKGNNIVNAIIRNTVYGIQLGEAKAGNESPVLKLFSTTITHSTVSGLSSLNASLEVANCEIMHCGNYCIYIGSGGYYSITGCTFFNRWEYGLRLTPAFFVNEKSNIKSIPININVNNCVIYGDNITEIGITPQNVSLSGNYFFDHCLVKLDTAHSLFWSRLKFPGVIVNKDPRFIDAANWDLRPDTLSPMVNNGNPVFSALYPFDIRGVSRTISGNPDIGAYERLTGEHKKEK